MKNFSNKEIEFLIRCVANNYTENEKDFQQEEIENINIGINDGISANVIGKLFVEAERSHRDIWSDVRKEKFSKTPINKKLFMGAGYFSTIACNNLHRRLQYAFSQLSGEQQNGGMGTQFDDESSNKAKNDIKSVIKDIMFALDVTIEDLK